MNPLSGTINAAQSLGFFSSRPNWDPNIPSPAGECVPPLWFRRGVTLACGSGGGGVPISDEGTDTVYFVSKGRSTVLTSRGECSMVSLWSVYCTCTLLYPVGRGLRFRICWFFQESWAPASRSRGCVLLFFVQLRKENRGLEFRL